MREKFKAVNDTFAQLTKRIKKKAGVKTVSKTWLNNYEKACRKLEKVLRQDELEQSERAAELAKEREAATAGRNELEKKLSLYKIFLIAMTLTILVLSYSYLSLSYQTSAPAPVPTISAPPEEPAKSAVQADLPNTPDPSLSPNDLVEPASAETTYTIQPGDTLSKIAFSFYGKGALWTRIYEANTDVLDSPDLINEGIILKIP